MDKRAMKSLRRSTIPFGIFHLKSKGKFVFLLLWEWWLISTLSPCRQQIDDVIDIDNVADYQEMVKKITDDKPSVVKIFVDMKHIEKLPRTQSSTKNSSSEDDSEATSSNGGDKVCKLHVWGLEQLVIFARENLGMLKKMILIAAWFDGTWNFKKLTRMSMMKGSHTLGHSELSHWHLQWFLTGVMLL